MREKLEREIKRKFGSVLGSKKLKEQRLEVVTDALDRYDEEIANGVSEADAYHTALSSVGDLGALYKSIDAKARRNRIAIAVIILLSVLILAFAAWVNWKLLFPTAVALALIGIAGLRLLTKNYEHAAPHIACVIVGGVLMVGCLLPIYIYGSNRVCACIVESRAHSHDLTERITEVESVSFVRVIELKSDADKGSFRYTVYETVEQSKTSSALQGLAALRYTPGMVESNEITPDSRGLLLRFSDDCPDYTYVLFCRNSVAFLRQTDDGFEITIEIESCDRDEWRAFMHSLVKEPYKDWFFD